MNRKGPKEGLETNFSVSRTPISEFRCFIAGGGTGGHLFPGIAVAKELEKRFRKSQIRFVVGRKRLEAEVLSRYGFRTATISVEGLKGRGWKKGLSVLMKLPKSILQSFSLIREFRPFLVLGMGGYSAGPMCLAARLAGVPTAIHEQNAYPGLTNRLLSGFVGRIFISFETSRAHFRGKCIVLTGNPVREELYEHDAVITRKDGLFTILVVGGSQGAKAINKAFAEALFLLKGSGKTPNVIHQTGRTDFDRVVKDYREKEIEGEIFPFIQDMASAYHRAELVVSRAGASTIFELAALGKPAVLIPYPHAANQHQDVNARALVETGGAETLHQGELTGESLYRVLRKYMDDPHLLQAMGAAAKKMGRPDAAKRIADQLEEMMTSSAPR